MLKDPEIVIAVRQVDGVLPLQGDTKSQRVAPKPNRPRQVAGSHADMNEDRRHEWLLWLRVLVGFKTRRQAKYREL